MKPLFRLHSVFYYQETLFNQHTNFIFLHYNTKIKICSLLSSITLKVNNKIGSNFDSCHLKDCILLCEELKHAFWGENQCIQAESQGGNADTSPSSLEKLHHLKTCLFSGSLPLTASKQLELSRNRL